jgi:hypothetical protein
MSIPIDNSTQLPQTAFTSGIPDFANINDWSKIESNLYNTSLGNIGIGTTNPDEYKLNINGSLNSTSLYQNGTQIDFSSYATNTALTNGLATKQNNLTALTYLLGMGSAITDIDYNKITLNKPTNFQADWNSTVINIPSTFPANMTNIYNKTEVNNISNSVLLLSSNLLYDTNYTEERQYPPKAFNTSNTPSLITYLEQNNVIYQPLTLNTDNISYGSGTYETYVSSRLVDSSEPKYLFNHLLLNNETVPFYGWINGTYEAITGNFRGSSNKYIVFGYIGEWIIFKFPYPVLLTKFRFYIRPGIVSRSPALWKCYGSNDGLIFNEIIDGSNESPLFSTDYAPTTLRYYEKTLPNNINPYLYIGFTINKLIGGDTSSTFLNMTELQFYGKEFINYTPIYTTSNYVSNISNLLINNINTKQNILTSANNLLGIGSAITAIDYNKITLNKPSTFPADMADIYTKTETDNLLNAKEAILTFNSPLTRTINTIELNQSLISYNNLADIPTIYTQSQTDALLNTKQNILTAATTLLGIGSSITDLDYNKITINKPATFPATMTDIYTKTETDNLLNAKEAILTFSSPIIRTVNAISLNQSLIDFNNLLNKPDMNLYLLKSGGEMTGSLFNSSTVRGVFLVAGDPTWQLLIQAPSSTTAASIQTIQQGVGYNQNLTLQATAGNVGIGTTNPGTNKLYVNGTTFLNGNTTIAGDLTGTGTGTSSIANGLNITGATNQAQSLFFRSNGYNLGIAGATGNYSSSAAANDMILRTIANTKLILQSGSGGAGIIIDSANNTSILGTLSFGSRTPDFLIYLYGTTYGFGINPNTLRYNSENFHRFYTGATNTATIDSSGNLTTTGAITSGTSSYIYAGGLRIGGFDTANTLYAGARDLGLTVDVGRNITFNSWTGVTNNIMTLNNTNITLNKPLSFKTDIWNTSTDNIYRFYFAGNATTNICSGGGVNDIGFNVLGSAATSYANNFSILNSGNATLRGRLTVNGTGFILTQSATASWFISIGQSPNGVVNSLIFQHRDTASPTINSFWWLNGTQQSTQSEISDERIKKEIKDIETPLNKIMTLKPKEYYLCDEKDYNKKFGIIAQDVEQVLPELVHTNNDIDNADYIANIYCEVLSVSNDIITIDKDITDLINVDDELKILLNNNDKSNLEIVIDDTPYNNRYKKRFVKVIEIIDNYSFRIDKELKEDENEKLFIYGKKVNDFKRLDYESIYCLNIAATQELYKIIQQLRLTLAEQQERISILEARHI